MDNQSISAVAVTLITVLGSNAAWKFYETRMASRIKTEAEKRRQEYIYRDDLRERVASLETKLSNSDKEKDELQKEIQNLVASIAALKVEVEYLRRENGILRDKLATD
jgi:peptidoglycan hydrolase CwlO-like protein